MDNDSGRNAAVELALRRRDGTVSVDSPAFPQQGQLDWVAFLRCTAEASISILARLSGSGVEPLTILVAQELCSTIRLSREGEKRVRDALSSLHYFSAFGDVLWFGFGVRHVTRSLAQTQEGVRCLALCAALAETHSAEMSALVLAKLSDILNVPRRLTPSISQWKTLVNTCSGCLTKSDFGSRVCDFISVQVVDSSPEASNPEDLARALSILAKVSRGEIQSATFLGGAECAWLGGVADWLLGLTVLIENERGYSLFSNLPGNGRAEPQITIIFENATEGSGTAGPSVKVLRQGYTLNKVSDLIREQLEPGYTSLCVRVPWESVLERRFGMDTLKLLLEISSSVGIAIGSAAAVFEAVCRAFPDVDQKLLDENMLYIEGSYGTGLLDTAIETFPELSSSIKSPALKALRSDFKTACMAYESAMACVSSTCTCSNHGSDNAKNSKPCLVAVVELVIYLSRSIAGFVVDEGLRPTMNGLEILYGDILQRQNEPALERLLGQTQIHPFKTPTVLYSGRACSSLSRSKAESISAIAHQGVCVYLDSLHGLAGSPESLARVHIVPGCIETDNRRYSEIRDAPWKAPNYMVKNSYIAKALPSLMPLMADRLNVVAILTETETSILFSYEISSSNGTSYVSPGAIAIASSRARGCVPCPMTDCKPPRNLPPLTVVEGEGSHKLGTALGCVIRLVPDDGPSWCVALMAAAAATADNLRRAESSAWDGHDVSYLTNWGNVILRTKECLGCCLRAAVRKGSNGGEIVYRV